MERLLAAYVAFLVKRGRAVIAACLLALAASVGFLVRLEFRTDLAAMVPRGDPVVDGFAVFLDKFAEAATMPVMVRGETADDVPAAVEALAAELSALPEVKGVRWKKPLPDPAKLVEFVYATADDDARERIAAMLTPTGIGERLADARRLVASPGGFAAREWVQADPLGFRDLLAARIAGSKEGFRFDPLSDLFRSEDGTAALLFVTPAGPASDVDYDARLVASVRSAANRVAKNFPAARLAVVWSGAHAHTLADATTLRGDLSRSSLVALALVCLIFLAAFGRARLLLVVTFPLVLAVGWSLAAAEVVFGGLTAMSIAFVSMLVGLGTDQAVYFCARLREESPGRTPAEAALRTLRALLGPIVMATGTTVVAFAALLASGFPGIREMGLLAAIGMTANLLAMNVFLPAVHVTWPLALGRPGRAEVGVPRLGAMADAVARRPGLVLAFVGAACAVLLVFGPAPRLELDFEKLRRADSEPARADRAILAAFSSAGRPAIALVRGDDLESALQANDRLADALMGMRAAGEIANVQSFSAFLPSLATRRARLEALAQGIDFAKAAADVRAAMTRAGFAPEAFAGFFDRLTPDRSRLKVVDVAALPPEASQFVRAAKDGVWVLTFFHPADARPESFDRAAARIREKIPGVVVTGFSPLDRALRDLIRTDLARVTLLAAAAVCVLLLLYYRRLRPVLATMLPLAAAIAIARAAAGALGITLNVFNLAAIPLVFFGIGVDYNLYLYARHRETGHASVREAMTWIGKPILVTWLTTVVGFGALLATDYAGIRSLGAIALVGLSACVVTSLLVVPALLRALFRPQA
jgi:predicted RND superfamily exporter protein